MGGGKTRELIVQKTKTGVRIRWVAESAKNGVLSLRSHQKRKGTQQDRKTIKRNEKQKRQNENKKKEFIKITNKYSTELLLFLVLNYNKR